jgi:EAL domain-containing protein (putative c-di-GMP-specific phosphodiesterase class I)
MADIDRFRYYNNSRGRSFGDALLTAVGARLRASLPEDTLFAHPGDDNFLIACTSTDDMASAIARVYALLGRCCAEPFLVEGEEVLVRMHASVLLAPSQADSAEAIERGLAAVLAEARSLDQPVQPYTEEVRVRAVRRSELERDLRVAIAQDQFELFLQPKFNAATHRLIGAEALLRWRHPERGMVSPAQFIPALEDTGLVIEVGAWVRREGLRIWKEWQALGHDGLRVAVNVSARELRHSDFVAQCAALLEPHLGEHGLDIEITESMLMDDISKSVSVLQDLRALGCRVGIDDFGTGYSSLNYLSRLPADTLKIDQSFTNAIALSADTLSLVTNIIGLAHSLGLSVVAEGVEEEEQAKLLRLLRCDELQGYHLGRPMPVADFRVQFLD